MKLSLAELGFALELMFYILDWFEGEPEVVDEFQEWLKTSGRVQ